MNNDITIIITSCWRIRLLKKTIKSLEKSCDLSVYEKIISEDTKDIKKINKIKKLNKNWFLKWWKIIFTWWIWNSNTERHYNALKKIYSHIKTKYVFHCEDDWYFKKVNFDFIKVSKKILEKNKNIWIIQLRNFEKDGWYNNIHLIKNERKNELFEKELVNVCWFDFLQFRNDKWWDICKWFSLNPWLRRTEEMKKIMFWYENKVNEVLMWKRMTKYWLISINFKDWICRHIWNSFLSTKIIEKWIIQWMRTVLLWTYNYRIRWQLFRKLNKIYYKLDLFWPTRWLMDCLSYVYRYFKIKPVNKELLENIEWIKEMNIPLEWFYEKKPLWISWVARLRNADDFLEKVIETHLPFLDEIILIDNLSTDKTKEICLKLKKKYPNKIKFFEYKYDVKPPGVSDNIKWNSIYSLAYYYNWCFSKSRYKYVMKVDDDNYFDTKKGLEIRKYILEKKPKKYITYYWFNLIKKDNKIGICDKNIYSGKYTDHWIYPVSNKTYYIQNWEVETFIFNLPYKRKGFAFFHLKFLKKKYWLINYKDTKTGKKQLNVIKKCRVIEIFKFIKINKNIKVMLNDINWLLIKKI